MKYMLLTYLEEKAWLSLGEGQRQQTMAECTPHVEQLIASGKRLVTDGPFAETREQVGGYTLIDAQDRDEAIAIAAGFLGTSSQAIIEIRAVAEVHWRTGGPTREGIDAVLLREQITSGIRPCYCSAHP